jgi:lipoprotein-anchoring transpeptidase ErfK/SrfK
MELLPVPTFTMTEAPLPVETSAPEVTSTPGTMYAEIVPDTPTPEYVAQPDTPYIHPDIVDNGGEHWIDVNLSQQRVYAYAGDTIVNSFVVSTGTWQTPTVTGKYRVWIKLRATDMAGPGYYLPDVPFTMYFYKGYALHGTYWHNNFGTPMSHGCVNLTIPDAEWLYNFSVVGTVVNVHY